MTEEYRRMKLKGRRSTHAHYMYDTYDGAPFEESLCGVEKLAEEWEDAPDDWPMHLSCSAVARAKAKRAAKKQAA